MNTQLASGFKSITTYEATSVVEHALGRLTAEQKSLLRSTLTFVVSYMESDSEMPPGGKHFREGFKLVFKAVHSTKDYRQFSSFDDWWSSFGENDGLVPVSSQTLGGMGSILGPFEGPHSLGDHSLSDDENIFRFGTNLRKKFPAGSAIGEIE